ncbi:MAG: hypothetical protein WA655_18105 [Candidatus Korobacteraceae bacterium]
MPDDLWPSNIADANLTTPVTILKQQGALLGDKTRQLITGEVVTQTTGNLFVNSFYISAPTLGYKYELFQVHHGINFYPLTLKHLNNTIQIPSEAAFKDKLKEILAAPHTVNVVHSILAQVRA